jgi:hypothetical protein
MPVNPKFDDYFKKKASRVRQRAKLLISRPDFQKDILDLRIKWGIPPEGFADDEGYRKWQRKINDDTDKYFETEWPKFKLKPVTKDHFMAEKEFNQSAPLNAISLDIKKLVGKYKLPLGWQESLRRYLSLNKIELMNLTCGITVHGKYDSDIDYSTLFIEIEDDTTLDDIKMYWPKIKEHQKRLESYKKKKFQPIKNFERDKLAFELDEQGKTLKEITEELNQKFDKEYDWTETSKFIQRHKQKSGMN